MLFAKHSQIKKMNKYRRGIGGLLNPLIIYQVNLKIILNIPLLPQKIHESVNKFIRTAVPDYLYILLSRRNKAFGSVVYLCCHDSLSLVIASLKHEIVVEHFLFLVIAQFRGNELIKAKALVNVV